MKLTGAALIALGGLACDTVIQRNDAEWTETRRVSPVDSTVDLDLSLRGMKGPGIGSQPPFLTVSCNQQHELQVFVAIHYPPPTGDSRVKYRFDQAAPISEDWLSLSDPGVLVPQNKPGFLKQLVKAKRLTFETSSGEIGLFDLTQLPKHLDEIRRDCNLPKLGR